MWQQRLTYLLPGLECEKCAVPDCEVISEIPTLHMVSGGGKLEPL